MLFLKELFHNESESGKLFEIDGESDYENFVYPVSSDTESDDDTIDNSQNHEIFIKPIECISVSEYGSF